MEELIVRQEAAMAQYVLCAKVYILIEKEELKLLKLKFIFEPSIISFWS